jgi:ribosomal subunit interface protein
MKPGKRTREEIRRKRRIVRTAGSPQAEVTVTFRHVEPTEAIRQYAQRKLAHMAKYLRRACQVHLTLTVDKYRQHGEVTVKSGRFAVAAQHETKDLYSVIDLLAAKVERQLKKSAEKIKARKVRARSYERRAGGAGVRIGPRLECWPSDSRIGRDRSYEVPAPRSMRLTTGGESEAV